jgi:phage-related protein
MGIDKLGSLARTTSTISSHSWQLNKVIIDVWMLLSLWEDIRSDNFWSLNKGQRGTDWFRGVDIPPYPSQKQIA